LKVVPTLIVLAVIPLGPPIVLPWFDGNWYRVPLHVADLNVGVLWLLAITSIGTYGVVLAGWASSNKYSMLGGLRATAQMISYELSMGLMLVVPVLIVGSMSIRDIIDAQGAVPVLGWFVFQNPLAAAILTFALIAEVNRAPFDLPEAEQELTAGYMTEYSGMKFALFMMAEYLGMIGVSLIAVSTFFGGYHFFLVDSIPILGPLVMIGKVIVLLIGMVWLRATLPRIRYDRLMSFGWKVMLPLALLAVSWTAIAVVIGDEFGQTGYMVFSTVVIALVAVVGFILLRRRAAEEVIEDDHPDDPIITGEQSGLGYAVIQLVGGIIAGPMLLYDWTVNLLERISTMAEEPASEEQDEDAGEEQSESAGSLPSETRGN
jgi:NADH-quinone oxidoreductase subunit H